MIFITGDTHGAAPDGSYSVDGFGSRFNKKNFPEQKEMTRDDYVIICGDFGGIWNYDSRYDNAKSSFREVICLDHGESREEKYWLNWLSEKPFTVLFCDGNHENHDRLSGAYPEVDFHGGRAHRIRENVFHLMRGYVFELDGLSFFVFGGAASHDISDGILRPREFGTEKEFRAEKRKLLRSGAMFRTEHMSWWKEEMPSGEEMERGLDSLSGRGWKTDYVVTHCAPAEIAALTTGYAAEDPLTLYLEKIKEKLSFRKWFFGHYHHNRQIQEKYVLLYEKIIRIR